MSFGPSCSDWIFGILAKLDHGVVDCLSVQVRPGIPRRWGSECVQHRGPQSEALAYHWIYENAGDIYIYIHIYTANSWGLPGTQRRNHDATTTVASSSEILIKRMLDLKMIECIGCQEGGGGNFDKKNVEFENDWMHWLPREGGGKFW